MNVFSGQGQAFVFIILQIFFSTRAVMKIGDYQIYSHLTLLDQSCASESIPVITYSIYLIKHMCQ